MKFDGVSLGEITRGLKTEAVGKRIIFYPRVSSTQEVARGLAEQEAEEGTVVLAGEQTEGRGRWGRTWVSPPGSGLYLSVILRPRLSPSQITQIPLVASVGVAEAIRQATSLRPEIKWPNDVTVNGKKLAGILSELSVQGERTNYVILGIGINVNTDIQLLPDKVRDAATSLAEETGGSVSRAKLLRCLLDELGVVYHEFITRGFASLRERWKLLSSTLGNLVRISNGAVEIEGKAVDIDPDGALIVQQQNGSRARITAGDVSLRNAGGGYS